MGEFNFDEWADLYKKDPDEFERRRRTLVDAEIQKAPIENRPMLRLLQLECDTAHETMDPLSATQAMLDLTLQSLNKLSRSITEIQNTINPGQ
jgi:hypothetical protein